MLRRFTLLFSEGSFASMLANLFSNSRIQKLWMYNLEFEHHEQRPLYFGEWF